MRLFVLPAFEHYALREISVRKVDQFIKTLAKTKKLQHDEAGPHRPGPAFGLAVRYDAIRETPVRDTARLRKPPVQAMSPTVEQIDQIRRAARGWRRGSGVPGPAPDSHLEQIIEVMLGTSARIGEGALDPQVRRRRHPRRRPRSGSAGRSCRRPGSRHIGSPFPSP
jgi:hypothetical protein